MAHTKSAKRKIRQYAEQRLRNSAATSLVKTSGRKMDKAVESKDQAAVKKAYQEFCSSVDKAAKKGSIPKRTAVRRKARAARSLRAVASA